MLIPALACNSLNAAGTQVSGTTTAQAQAALPTDTPAPTDTATSTPTDAPTDIPTATATDTATATLPPDTQTAVAKETQIAQATQNAGATKTSVAAAATATRAQLIANNTGTAQSVGATRTEQASIKTSTAAAVAATKTFLAEFKAIDRRELTNYADNHIGEKVFISGRVFNIIDSQTMQVWMGSSLDALVVQTSEKFSGVYEDDRLTFYGTVVGFYEGTNSFGGSLKQPALKDAFFIAPGAPPTATPLPGGAVLISCNPNGGTVNVGNVSAWWIESPGGGRVAGNGNTGAYMYSFQRAIYTATDGSGPYTFCKGTNWSP